VEGWRRWLRLAVGLVLLVVLYFSFPFTTSPDRSDAARLAVSLLVMALLSAGVIWQVRLALIDSSRHVDGLVFALALAIVAFAVGFYAIEQQSPEQITGLDTRLDALYFTMTTLMTIGYGDVHAVGQFARGVVVVQIVFNVVVIASAAATLNRRVREKAIEHAQERAASGAPVEHRLIRRRGQGRSTHRNPT
jgi:voltage-gated potassium channel